MLQHLPTEIALQTVSFLPLYSLYSVILVSRDWNALITTNEPTVFRNAAILHRFIDENQLRTGSIPDDWKVYCRRELEIEKGWHGRGPSVVRELTATGTSVHRLKVDHELGFVITTCQTGGLFVCDIESNRILWALPKPSQVVQYAHLEYDRGFIVFNRYDNCKEVWRHVVDMDGDQRPEASPPDKKMLDASAQAASNYGLADSRRGHFTAWALLQLSEPSRAFRFSYPTLLAVATNNAYLWDIPRLQPGPVIRDIQRKHLELSLLGINYVEINDLYVFICGVGCLRIFAREGGALLYQLSTRELSCATWDVLPTVCGLSSSVVQPRLLAQNHHPPSLLHSEFMACHVSVSGKDLAVLTTDGRLVILPGFQRLFSKQNELHHRDIAITLNFQPNLNDEDISCYLAVGNRTGKLALATQKGIYVISPDFDFTRLTADCPPEPGVSVCRLSKFDDERFLFSISCLQITHDAIYCTYKASPTGNPSNTHHAHVVHGADDHDPLDTEVFLDGAHEDGFIDEWQDGDSEDEEMEMGLEDDDDDHDQVHAIIQNLFLPTATNTVYTVNF